MGRHRIAGRLRAVGAAAIAAWALSSCGTPEGLTATERAVLVYGSTAVDEVPNGRADAVYGEKCDPGPYSKYSDSPQDYLEGHFEIGEWDESMPMDESRRVFRKLHEAAAKCLWDPVAYVRDAGCADIGARIDPVPEVSRYMSGSSTRTSVGAGLAAMAEDIHSAVFEECLIAALVDAYESLGDDPPGAVTPNMLAETYIEICGEGERTFVVLKSWSAAGGASGTDALLLNGIVDTGHSFADAVTAVASGYADNGIACDVRLVSAEDS